MSHKVIASNATMKAAGTVVKKLARWLVQKGYAADDESARELVRETARDLPATQKLLDELEDWLAATGPSRRARQIEGHFRIDRVEPGQIWLEPMIPGNEPIGPIVVPAKIARACKVGWDLGGAVARTGKGWRLVEAWNISP